MERTRETRKSRRSGRVDWREGHDWVHAIYFLVHIPYNFLVQFPFNNLLFTTLVEVYPNVEKLRFIILCKPLSLSLSLYLMPEVASIDSCSLPFTEEYNFANNILLLITIGGLGKRASKRGWTICQEFPPFEWNVSRWRRGREICRLTHHLTWFHFSSLLFSHLQEWNSSCF